MNILRKSGSLSLFLTASYLRPAGKEYQDCKSPGSAKKILPSCYSCIPVNRLGNPICLFATASQLFPAGFSLSLLPPPLRPIVPPYAGGISLSKFRCNTQGLPLQWKKKMNHRSQSPVLFLYSPSFRYLFTLYTYF